jgi:DNA mismatch repair ATPase MutS
MLTTHFIDLCQHLEKKSGSFANYHMHTREKDDGSIEYLYELKDGISHVRGGVQVLKDMKYPEEIILNL